MSNTTRRFMMGAAGAGGAETKYVENNFSTQLYKGTAAARSITSGVDLSTDGGLVITKNRDSSSNWAWGSPIAAVGTGKYNRPNTIYGASTDANSYTAFNDDGYTIGSSSVLNASNDDFVSYSFKKTPGLIDVISYVGNDAASRVLDHNLGSVPGCIAVICTTKNENKTIWHRGFGERVSGSPSEYFAFLDGGNAARNSSAAYPALPTATQLTIGSYVNINGETYVAYIFAGGASTAATARSVVFDGSNDKVSIPDSTDFEFGSGDFTIEAWVKQANAAGSGASSHTIVNKWHNTSSTKEWILRIDNGTGSNVLQWLQTTNGSTNQITTGNTVIGVGQWHHVAVVGHSGTIKLFVDGIQQGATGTQGTIHAYSNELIFGYNQSTSGQWMDGAISNCRIVKGTAVYTSSFTPPYVPLTNITNTKLLCLNNSSVTGSTVSPGTLTNDGATASTDSPFDDPEGFKFGEEEDQNIIKTGSFQGSGSDQKLYLGWEPQWFLWKQSSSSSSWIVFDSMRGIVTGGNDELLYLNMTSAAVSAECISLDPDGVTFKGSAGLNPNGHTLVYMAVRRPDGYVSKPAKAGTDAFAMDVGSSSSTIPEWDSGFPVDLGLYKTTGSTQNWHLGARLIQEENLYPNTSDAEAGIADNVFDSNLGWGRSYAGTYGSAYQSWMWKRGAGFDVVTYAGNSTNRQIRHSMGIAPTMIWLKSRTSSEAWVVGSSGLSSWAEYLTLNNDDAESTNAGIFNSTAPTATAFSLGSQNRSNENNQNYIAFLFASVDGISKVGSYTGNGYARTITTGFQPRFIIFKRTDDTNNWIVLDTRRGWSSGNDAYMRLNTNSAQISAMNFGEPTSTGFTLPDGNPMYNQNNAKYIYYAHA